ncbi:uncharacterized protein LOC128385668 [Panonychus citri]|uniref:uncharacterized protein LOC128385668 n=1 Tax=Panonychus citri TaxID=50023 RepID=UPI002307DAE5|nr:uncharacterized protein LOC128385668 [Panonychus citri]
MAHKFTYPSNYDELLLDAHLANREDDEICANIELPEDILMIDDEADQLCREAEYRPLSDIHASSPSERTTPDLVIDEIIYPDPESLTETPIALDSYSLDDSRTITISAPSSPCFSINSQESDAENQIGFGIEPEIEFEVQLTLETLLNDTEGWMNQEAQLSSVLV